MCGVPGMSSSSPRPARAGPSSTYRTVRRSAVCWCTARRIFWSTSHWIQRLAGHRPRAPWGRRSLRPTSPAGKVVALFDRAAARDFADVFMLSRRFSKAELLQLAAEVDAGFDHAVFAGMIVASVATATSTWPSAEPMCHGCARSSLPGWRSCVPSERGRSLRRATAGRPRESLARRHSHDRTCQRRMLASGSELNSGTRASNSVSAAPVVHGATRSHSADDDLASGRCVQRTCNARAETQSSEPTQPTDGGQ